ncbi:MAG: patatin-like phospholipase family protein [Pseudomonadota bacterium]
MTRRALSVYAGKVAANRIAERGWSAELFSLLVGASGGPKWFVLTHLDRLLFGDFLHNSNHRLTTIGSSIGAWRNTCLAMPDPIAAIDALQAGYLYQRFSSKPTAAEVSESGHRILRGVLGEHGARELANHPRIQTHIVTSRGRGPAAASSKPLLATGMGAAALGNAISRGFLKHLFQRVVFHSSSEPNSQLLFHDFNTCFCTLEQGNVYAVLHASGAIPFVLTGERDITGAPAGQYWDGGIVDYHFDLRHYLGEGLILYPHFSASVVPGWFDKGLPWRRAELKQIEKLVLLCPSDEFVAQLPQGKIPDRGDFTRMGYEERVRYWQNCIEESLALAEDMADLLQGKDPLAGVNVLG